MYSRVEEERLVYIKKGRIDQLERRRNQLEDAYLIDPEPLTAFNESVRLPASFVGSRSWASNQVADALALCREYGKPSFFVTMTTNPNWPEIKNSLLPGQCPSDDPVLVCRVFHERLAKCKEFIRKRFGTLKYLVSVIEFQKRGLPHAHVVFKVR